MKVLTLTQPRATLMAIRAKTIETRSWNTAYRGWLGIHAAKGFPREARAFAFSQPCAATLDRAGYSRVAQLPFGAIVAYGQLVDVVEVDYAKWQITEGHLQVPLTELDFGDYTAGRFAWIFDRIVTLWNPMPARGQLGLWECAELTPL